jgi:16S rRNA (uracil1498-N3)-methyltransferase
VRGPRRPDTLFWVDPTRVAGHRLSLDAAESRHLLRVFRAEPGTLFDATDGAGHRYHCRLSDDHHGEARAEILSRETDSGELPRAIHLLVGLPDYHAAESVVEHDVPLGVASIVFAVCRRSGRDELGHARLDRLERIAVAGVKQSLRSRLPILGTTPSLATALVAAHPSTRFVADPGGGALGEAMEGSKLEPHLAITIAVGPAGGFDDGEAAELRAAKFSPISLGPNRLTTETAALTLLATVRNVLLHGGLGRI